MEPIHVYSMLSGRFHYSTPSIWMLDCHDSTVALIPRPLSLGLMLFLVVIGATVIGIFIYFWREMPFWWFSPLVVIIILGLAGLIHGLRQMTQRQGPFLAWNIDTGQVALPQHNIVLRQDQVRQLEIVGGWWSGDGRHLSEDCSELYLVAEVDNEIRIFPLVAESGRSGLDQLGAELARRLPVLVLCVKQNMRMFKRTSDSITVVS